MRHYIIPIHRLFIDTPYIGFGGTNGHAILESYEAPQLDALEIIPAFTPLVVSAASKRSLRRILTDLRDFLTDNLDTNMRDLAYTLHTRRTTLQFRQVIAGLNVQEVIKSINEVLSNVSSTTSLGIRHHAIPAPKVLAIFTGQGAQWCRMGAHLILTSQFAASCLEELDDALSTLPKEDQPSWSLKTQLLADSSESRLSEAEISQPLCTAVQILLVQMTRLAKIKLHAVVGHSSGEIAAAYTAGFLSAKDAIRIAYYRGLYARLAQSPNGSKGAMIAVGTSYEDAYELCKLEDFDGRVRIAARNCTWSLF